MKNISPESQQWIRKECKAIQNERKNPSDLMIFSCDEDLVNRFVRDGELAKVMSNHLRLHFHLFSNKEKIARNIKTQQLNQTETSKKY